MTCPFCGIKDDSIGEYHYLRHQIEYVGRIAKALEYLNNSLDIWVPSLLERLDRLPKPKGHEL